MKFPLKFGITLTIPSFRTSSTYSLQMTQGFKIKASGDASSQFGKWSSHVEACLKPYPMNEYSNKINYTDNVTITMRFLASEYQREGDTYIKIDDVKVELTPGKIQVNFENLMPHAKLNESLNKTINQSIPMFIPQYKPRVEEELEKYILKCLNEALEMTPSAELLPY